jgi:ABC-type multidrug transport system fused ATPase/permease subunit
VQLLDRDLRRAIAHVVPYWRRLALVLTLSLVSTVAALYIPYLTRLLIDRALLGADSRVLVRVIGQFAALTLGSFFLNVVSGLIYTRTSAEILFDMRLALFRQLQRLSPRFYAEMPVGQIATRLNADIGEIQRVAAEIALAWVGNVIFLVGSVVICSVWTVCCSPSASRSCRFHSGHSCAIARGSRRQCRAFATGALTSAAFSSRRCWGCASSSDSTRRNARRSDSARTTTVSSTH